MKIENSEHLYKKIKGHNIISLGRRIFKEKNIKIHKDNSGYCILSFEKQLTKYCKSLTSLYNFLEKMEYNNY